MHDRLAVALDMSSRFRYYAPKADKPSCGLSAPINILLFLLLFRVYTKSGIHPMKTNPLAFILVCLVLLQAARFGLKQIAFLFLEKSYYNDTLISLFSMLLLAVFIVLIAIKHAIPLSLKPDIASIKGKVIYGIFSVFVLVIIFLSPLFTRDYSLPAIIILLYSTIVTPIFEELIFRGYGWNIIQAKYKSEFKTYVITTILFALWHIGYIDSVAMRVSADRLLFTMFMKVITGLCFGIVIGFIRYKSKNSFAAILTHSIMNVFGR